MTFRKKLIITAVLGILLILLYVIIFGFSSQNGEISGNLSMGMTTKMITFICNTFGEHMPESIYQMLIIHGENILRKTAHFTEYMCMGILILGILRCYVSNGKAYLISILWVAVSATLDEWHQYYVPGRYASVWDVLLDTFGGMTGACLCVFFMHLIQKALLKKNRSIS